MKRILILFGFLLFASIAFGQRARIGKQLEKCPMGANCWVVTDLNGEQYYIDLATAQGLLATGGGGGTDTDTRLGNFTQVGNDLTYDVINVVSGITLSTVTVPEVFAKNATSPSIDPNNSLVLGTDGELYYSDPDDDSLNEIQSISIVGDQLTLSSGGGTVTLPFSTAVVETIVSGANVVVDATDPANPIISVPSVDDADADPTNEIELPIGGNGGDLLQTDGAGNYSWVTPPLDSDTDPTNEIQSISTNAVFLTLSDGGGTVTLPYLSVVESSPGVYDLSEATGGAWTIDANDADSDPTNEIELPIGGVTGDVLQTDGAGNYSWVTPATGGASDGVATSGTYDAANEEIDVTVSAPGSDFSIDVAGLAQDADIPTNTSDLVNDSGFLTTEVDGSTTNEIQQLDVAQLNGTDLELSLSDDGVATQTIDLSSLQDGIGTDDQNISGSELIGTDLTIGIEGGTSETVDLSTIADQTVVVTDGGSGNVVVGGTYPNLTIDVPSLDDADADPTNEIELPTGGVTGDVLQTDGAGNYSWTTPVVDTDDQTAAEVTYDPALVSLVSTDVQGAISELSVNQVVLDQRTADLNSLSGQPAGTTDYGTTFTGSTIPDGTTTTGALQALETALELDLDQDPTNELPTYSTGVIPPTVAGTEKAGDKYEDTAAGIKYEFDGTVWSIYEQPSAGSTPTAVNGLRVVGTDIQKGSDDATDAKGSQLLHETYTHLDGFTDNWIGTVNDAATKPVMQIEDTGDVFWNTNRANYSAGITSNYYMHWDASVGHLRVGSNFGANDDTRNGLRSMSVGLGSSTSGARNSAIIGQRTFFSTVNGGEVANSLAVADRVNIRVSDQAFNSIFAGSASNLDNRIINNSIFALSDSDIAGTSDIEESFVSLNASSWGVTARSETMNLLMRLADATGSFVNGYYNLYQTSSTENGSARSQWLGSSRSLVLAGAMDVHPIARLEDCLIVGNRISIPSTLESTFQFGQNIQNSGDGSFVASGQSINAPASITSPFDIDNTVSRKFVTYYSNGYDFGTSFDATGQVDNGMLLLSDNSLQLLDYTTGNHQAVAPEHTMVVEPDGTVTIIEGTPVILKGSFDDDADAIANGLSAGDSYQLSATNTLGLPAGIHKTVQ